VSVRHGSLLSSVLAGVLAAFSVAAQPANVEFEPKVGAVGSRIVFKTPPPPGAEVRFGGRPVPVLREISSSSIFVPSGSATGFLEYVQHGKVIARSAVPFVVTGNSLAAPRLVGLKEAIDVFGYADLRPEGGEKPESATKPILSFGEDDILTIGEPPPPRLMPAVELGDAASAARTGMGPSVFTLTARPPKKKLPPPPSPTPGP
jgi:hypothetical protein